MARTNQPYRELDARKIIETVCELQNRVEERFPEAGLRRVVTELRAVADETAERIRWIQKPHLPLRAAAGLLVASIVGLLIRMILNYHHLQVSDFPTFIQMLEAGISALVFIGAAVLFLFSCETRVKRSRALRAIHELRAMAHIVDMHQLTKDPHTLLSEATTTASSPKRTMGRFELGRYLDYCSETLALISKIAALYVQGFNDPVLLAAVDEVETLTAGFSRKIWQKITILENCGRTRG